MLQAEPIYDYELPWFFFTYDAGGVDMDVAIVNALQKEKFKWISKIPISAIKVLREKKELDYMRNILRNGITDLKARQDKDLVEISETIERNFKEAFKRQKSELANLRKEVTKIISREIPITAGGFLAGFVPAVGNVISFLFAGRDIKNLLRERKNLKTKIEDYENNSINLLMKSYE